MAVLGMLETVCIPFSVRTVNSSDLHQSNVTVKVLTVKGNVHTAIVCPKEAKQDADKLLKEIQLLALELEGTITGEHGVGLKLTGLLAEEVGQAGVDVMRKIKFALDPKGILNPDKVVSLGGDF